MTELALVRAQTVRAAGTVAPDRSERTVAARERANRTMFGLHQLLSARPELRGVHAAADFTADAIRWSV